MPIRFQCSGCSQPIEVDDEWASKAVACPYCRRTVTAPAESTLDDLALIPTAKALDDAGPAAYYPPPPGRPTYTGRNTLAVVAAVLTAVAFAAVLGAGIVMSQHEQEITSVMDRAETLEAEGMGTFGALQRAGMEFYDLHGGTPPGWMMAAIALEFGGLLSWLAAVVCGIIAVLRPIRRGLATAALAGCGVFFFLFCCLGALGL